MSKCVSRALQISKRYTFAVSGITDFQSCLKFLYVNFNLLKCFVCLVQEMPILIFQLVFWNITTKNWKQVRAQCKNTFQRNIDTLLPRIYLSDNLALQWNKNCRLVINLEILITVFSFDLSDMPKLNTNRFDHEYKIGKVLGEGGFGRVYSAVRLRDNFPVAVKQVSRHKIPSLVTVS